MLEIEIPVRTVSEANTHTHWRERQRRAQDQRFVASSLVRSRAKKCPRPPCIVTLTRLSPRELDDDNLRGALKHVRDGVADALGVDDRDPSVTWAYAQARGAFAVRIAIVPKEST